MRIVACVAEVPDPEVAPARREVRADGRGLEPWTGHYALGPFDGNALELALQLRELASGTVTALSVGGAESQSALRKAAAVTADEILWVQQPTDGLDARQVAALLAAAIRSGGTADVVLCGRQGGEWDSGQVGPEVAHELGVEHVGFVRRITEVVEGRLVVEREVESGLQLYECSTPCLLVVTNEDGNQLRAAKVKDVMRANRAQAVLIPPSGVDAPTDDTKAGSIRSIRRIPITPRVTERLVGAGREQIDRLVEFIESTMAAR